MNKTVLITGSSTGIGMETALFFHKKKWTVVATMRNPDTRTTDLHAIDDILKLHLDVLDNKSITTAIEAAIEKFGKIDVIVNNAGYGLVGAFEASNHDQINRQFDTNVFGLMTVIREILPTFRKQQSGTIINIASIGGRLAFPLYSLYHATKWAVEGFSESLQYELKPFNIKVKVVEPGPIKTDFYDRSADIMKKQGLTAYDGYVERAMKIMLGFGEKGVHPRVVASTIYKAASTNSWKLRYPVNTQGMLAIRKLMPDALFSGLVRTVITK